MKNKILILIISLCAGFGVMAQPQGNISGKVVDRWGKPVAGAMVVNADNEGAKVATNYNGEFTIAAQAGNKLIIRTSEYAKKTVEVENTSEPVSVTIDFGSEAVYNGFGIKQTMTESTAAISQAYEQDIDKRSALNAANSLFGNALGLTALQNADNIWGNPANFNIRGLQTLSNNGILILVDGFERPINTLTVEEVESVSVLRDAAAVALYGYKGVNGVLSVKTKRGKYQSREINVKYDHAFNSQVRLPEFADSYTYATALNEALVNDGYTPRYSQNDLKAFKSGQYPYLYPNVDWFKEVYRDRGYSNIYNVDFRGGGMRMRYYTALNLQTNHGFINGADSDKDYSAQMKYSKGNIRTNLDIDISSSTKLEIGMRGYLTEFNRPGLNSDNMINWLYTVPSAAYPVKTEDGVWGGNSTWGTNTNPSALAHARGFSKGHNRALYADAKLSQGLDFITKGLSAAVRVGYDNLAAYWEGSIKGYEWASDAATWVNGVPSNITRIKGGAVSNMNYDSKLDYQDRHLNIVGNIDYDRTFGKHGVFASLIYNYEKAVRNGQHNTLYRQSFAAYAHYSYMNRYIADVTLMTAGSSRLAPGHKYNFSPTVSAAWVVSNENFMKSAKFVDFLKVRASAGIINADFIPTQNYWAQNFPGGGGYHLGNNYGWLGGREEGQLPTENIKNERAFKYNFGIDASFLNSIVMTADAFYEKRDNIFVSGAGSMSAVLGNWPGYINAGRVDSYGFEAGVAFNRKFGDFTVNLGGKFTLAKSEIKEMLEESRPYSYLRRTGQPVGQIFGLQAIGFFIDEGDILNSPIQQFSYTKPGDVKYKDQNGDGYINEYDEVPLGYNTGVPEIYFSFDIGFEWKGLGFSATFQGAGNYSALLSTKSLYMPLVNNATISKHYFGNRWTPATATTAKYPRLTTESNDNNFRNSTVWLADASFMKLRNCEIYYKLPASILSKLRMKSARVYVRGVDLLTFDKLDIVDPEAYGVTTPLTKSVNIGITIGF